MKRRSWIATGVSVVAVAAIVGGVYAATSAVQRPAEESPTIAPNHADVHAAPDARLRS